MKYVPSYAKILTLGSAYTEHALDNSVVIQEKVDGSFFGFGLNEDERLVARSKGVTLDLEAPDGMFKKAIEYVKSIEDQVVLMSKDSYFYCEYLQKPKHNTLKYKRTPKNNLVLFDALVGGKWVSRDELVGYAERFGIDLIPELYVGKATADTIKALLERQSYLEDETIEGVVIKDHSQTIMLGGQVMPLFTKHVREAFKERHASDWKVRSPRGSLFEFIEGFRAEPRWVKAVQYLRDQGQLTDSPKDIASLIQRVKEDVKEEEQENIKQYLYKCFIEDILRSSIKGLPEWYKASLLDHLK